MKKDLMDILACPVCKGELKLTIEKEQSNDIITGSLLCRKCNHTYLIKDSIPDLLPPKKS